LQTEACVNAGRSRCATALPAPGTVTMAPRKPADPVEIAHEYACFGRAAARRRRSIYAQQRRCVAGA